MGRRVASFVFARCACRSIAGLMRAMWRAPLRARRRRRLSTSALLASSTPLFRDVLPVESLGENRWARKVAALGVALAFEVLLEEPSAPGWLPALLDEQRVPLSGPMPPIPPRSFSFTEGHGAEPIGVVRLNARCHSSSSPAHIDLLTCSLVIHPIRPRACNPQMHQYVLLLVERLRMTVGELVMAYACVERVLVLHPTTMRVNSIRPMLLGACVIASKTSRDRNFGLWQVAPSRTPCVFPCAPPNRSPQPRPPSCVPRKPPHAEVRYLSPGRSKRR